MNRHLITVCTLGLLALAGCSQPPAADTREADARVLRDGEVAAFLNDWSGRDVARIVAHYADDGNVMVPNFPIMTGKDAMRTALKGVLADPNWSLALQPVQVEVSRGGDLGYARGTYVNTSTDPVSKKAVREKGKFLTVFRRGADGSWKAIQDISNADAPATPSGK
jgi:ketosteroid isomerase-like protein